MPPSSRETDPRIIAAIVASALFMQNLDGSVVATALPSMARDLDQPPLHLSTAITAYLVALTVFIPLSGWVADRFGAKRVFMAAIAVFTFASLLCGMAQGLGSLVGARVLQGLGGAMMVPVGRLLLLRKVRKEELLSATTWLTMPALIGPVCGPPLGGFLTDAISWRAVFWVNLPVGLIGLLLIWRFIPDVEQRKPQEPDLPGMTLVGTALTLLMVGVETVGRGLFPRFVPETCIVLGVVIGALAIRHCRRAINPAVDLALLSIPSFRAPTIAGSIFRMGAGAVPFLVPLSLQIGFGVSASQSGMVSLASALGAFCMKPMTRFALSWFAVKDVLVWNTVVSAVVMLICGFFAPGWPMAAIFVVLLIGGLSRSLQFTSMNALAFADVPPARLSAATSFYGTAQQAPQAVGVAVAAGTMQLMLALNGHDQPAGFDFTVAFAVASVLVLAGAPLFASLPRDAGAGIASGRVAPSKQA
ncbi:multidrug efflux MFS transporter [Acetobacteraceae bacterium H6797]|nr:multidrug efflux MFS transporter [Acetobacteraceae bacterium H6797]